MRARRRSGCGTALTRTYFHGLAVDITYRPIYTCSHAYTANVKGFTWAHSEMYVYIIL